MLRYPRDAASKVFPKPFAAGYRAQPAGWAAAHRHCYRLPASRACCIECGMYPDIPEVRPPPPIDVPPHVQGIARAVLGGAALTRVMAAIIIRLALPVPDGSTDFAHMAFEMPFSVPKRSIPIPVHPALVHPGWCQPANDPICQEI